ncbi:PHP domain-containing protein, partial [Clostridiaceae bacterium HSG29]|nr:PHP domain-containing protein [Clostridiaceae bacterium HSG29]
MNRYINYHKHTYYSNISTPDSTVGYNDYINRISELGYGMMYSVEHGNQGNYLECYEKSKNNNIKFGFGTEAYWVIDNKQKDRTNNHIIILAKSEKGMKAINLALSYANIEGFYYKPRLSLEQILNLPKDDVFITTACIAFNGYGEEISKSIILKLYEKFKDNFMLEVQNHHTELQKDWNKFLLNINKEYGIKLIAGMDSHYIYPEQHKERDALLKAKHINYENEEGWFLDYPSYETAYDRFIKQGILSREQITQSLQNTLILLDFNDIEFNKDIKVPNIFPDKTYEERVVHFKEILRNAWNKEVENIPIEKRPLYIEEIKKEINIVIETKMADYFILNYYVIKRAKELGGRLTLTSRGSAPSFYITKLLGFTTIDRISAPIKLYPERFMSISRILETRAIPDVDMNCGNPEVFIQAQREILGENSTYYMISYGTLKVKSAFKTYSRANEIGFEESNTVTKGISNYESSQKHSEKILNIEDYIDKSYIDMFNESTKYQGIIDSASRNPCACISHNGNVLKDIGVIKLRDDIVTIIDGKYLDGYKYVKNDFLKVNVVDIIYKTFELAGIKPIPSNELMKIVEKDKKVWGLFYDGITMGLNQVEQEGTRNKIMQYRPSTVSELSNFIAGIRPGFASMIDKFLKREKFSYGIKDFDELIQTEQMQDSWLLYQEQIMQTLEYAGFPVDECYSLIKAIAKKVEGVVDEVEDRFIKGFIAKNNTEADARKVWQIIIDNSKYSFNSSHSLSVALDSLYGAYLKAYYPYEFYKVMLDLYTENKDIDKVSALKKEMEYFNIHIGDLQFGLNNTGFVIDKKNNRINQSLKTVKFINSKVCEDMKLLGETNPKTFAELLTLIKSETSVNTRQVDVLIKIDYFKKYGSIKKLLKFYEWFNTLTKRKTFKKE